MLLGAPNASRSVSSANHPAERSIVPRRSSTVTKVTAPTGISVRT
jgi:hypothetical protein